MTIWLGAWSMFALSLRYGLGPNGLGVEPRPSEAIHTMRSQRWVLGGGTGARVRLRRFPRDFGEGARGPPGQPVESTGAVATRTG